MCCVLLITQRLKHALGKRNKVNEKISGIIILITLQYLTEDEIDLLDLWKQRVQCLISYKKNTDRCKGVLFNEIFIS